MLYFKLKEILLLITVTQKKEFMIICESGQYRILEEMLDPLIKKISAGYDHHGMLMRNKLIN